MFEAPSTPYALCLWLRSDQRGELLAITAKLASMLAPAFKIDHAVDTFCMSVQPVGMDAI